ncbi:MAG: DUF6776 family protein [Pseudomonadota bacterium]
MWHKVMIRVLMVAAIVFALYVGWWLYDLGKVRGVLELKSLRTQFAVVEKLHKNLSKDNKVLREQVAILERSSQIDQQAAQDVKADLGQLEMELQAAREEVEFYRGIVAPGDVQSGLRIHRFNLEGGAAPGKYHYELVLTQLKHNDKYVTGIVDWKIAGLLLGEPGEVALAGVTSPSVKQLKFRFRYFQELAGTITLPEGFEAEKVTLSIKPGGKGKSEPVKEVFDWPAQDSR